MSVKGDIYCLQYSFNSDIAKNYYLYLNVNLDTYLWISEQKELIYRDDESSGTEDTKRFILSIGGVDINLKEHILIEDNETGLKLLLQSMMIMKTRIADDLLKWLDEERSKRRERSEQSESS